MAIEFLATMALGATLGFVLYRLNIPGGMLVGSILGAVILNVGFDFYYVPPQTKILAQLAAGAFIGVGVTRSDIYHLRKIYKAAIVLLGTYLVFTLLFGAIIYRFTPLDAATAFFCAVPGGINDVPLIAADMGANAAKVTVIQFTRLVVVIGIFPSTINALCKDEEPLSAVDKPENSRAATIGKQNKHTSHFLTTFAVALAAGGLGAFIGLPAGPLLFSLIGVIALNFFWGKAYLPMWVKRVAQVLSGAYIGRTVTHGDLLQLWVLIFPALLLVVGYSFNCFFTGWLLRRFCGMGKKESLLAATPAGASDMALISSDMGVQSTDLVVLHVLRLVIVSAVFPQVIRLVLWTIGL